MMHCCIYDDNKNSNTSFKYAISRHVLANLNIKFYQLLVYAKIDKLIKFVIFTRTNIYVGL